MALWPSGKSTSKMTWASQKNGCHNFCSWSNCFCRNWAISPLQSHFFDLALLQAHPRKAMFHLCSHSSSKYFRVLIPLTENFHWKAPVSLVQQFGMDITVLEPTEQKVCSTLIFQLELVCLQVLVYYYHCWPKIPLNQGIKQSTVFLTDWLHGLQIIFSVVLFLKTCYPLRKRSCLWGTAP